VGGEFSLSIAILCSCMYVVSFFRIFDSVRATIRMIWTICSGTLAFFIVFLAFVLSFAFSYQALWDRDWIQAWMAVYMLVMGEFGPMADDHGGIFKDHPDMRIWFSIATLFLNLVLLNMVIALMGELYGNAMATKGIVDMKEKLRIINKHQRFAILPRLWKLLEFGTIEAARNIEPEEKYLHSIKDAYGDGKKRELLHQKLTDLKSLATTNFEEIHSQMGDSDAALRLSMFTLNQAMYETQVRLDEMASSQELILNHLGLGDRTS